MALTLLSGPPGEPLTLTQAKAHLRVEGSDEDLLISSIITASRVHLETALSFSLMTQSWSYRLDRWPDSGVVTLPLHPVQSVSEIRVYDENDVQTIVSASEYLLDAGPNPARLVCKDLSPWPKPARPIAGIEILFSSGYGDAESDVPEPLRQAVRLLVAHWYERREPLQAGLDLKNAPRAIHDIIAPYRMQSL